MKNAYNWYNVFILFDFAHKVWKVFKLVENPNCYCLHKMHKMLSLVYSK